MTSFFLSLLQLYKKTLTAYTSVSVTMSLRKQEQQRLRKARQQPIMYEDSGNVDPPDPASVPAPLPELDTCVDIVSTALANPNRAMLRRVFFIAEDKSKFVSVGYFPARGYQPLAEFGGAKKLPLLLDIQQLQILAENIASLCNALQTNILARRTVT